ncbi:acetyl-CoA C-acyltransferase [Aromatoleum toluvorans]|uniref:Acetyl-CoA C-acyltransferase n=1 Tax=Aromatoleum toluvorans TaxID=92002 RepID=A0ABX1Q0B0_9RHOO|nr:thiolase family protein [Aromatoleum toluvorans]NMG45122.1 acetyl-CoA C-acyltransferase [Aromatoleum toluvorans]
MSQYHLNEALILGAVRTPFGRRGGALRDTRPDELLAAAIGGVLARTGLPGERVGDVLAGCVSQAGEQGANIARQAALLAGLPAEVPGVSMNRMCGSSQFAVHAAAQAVAAGDLDFAIGCGVESMSRVPMFLDLTLGKGDFRGFDGLHPDIAARYAIPHQVESAERVADAWRISRAEMDDYAMESHRRAEAARAAGLHAEILPLKGVDKEGAAITLAHDEGIRAAIDAERMRGMQPVFRRPGEGGVTAANASQMSDGASAVLVGSRAAAEALGIRPRARFRARVAVGSDPVMQLTGVIPAARRALELAGLSMRDLDWIELNEAFASVALCFVREFEPDMERFNPWGGAIAHGHPLGGTGAGLMAKMLAGLEHRDGRFGLQVMCIGHGMATATVVERL